MICEISGRMFVKFTKHAKDIAAFGVLLSIFITLVVWPGFIIYFSF